MILSYVCGLLPSESRCGLFLCPVEKTIGSGVFFFFHLTVNILFIGNECKVSENLHS